MDESTVVQSLPHSVVAHGWIPFVVVTALSLVFSVLYVVWFRSDKAQHKAWGNSIIAVLGLFISLVTSILVPVDVFLISFMKNSDGSWKPWAESSEVRDSLKDSILYAYYACYAIILFFGFLVIPANFFYHGLDPGLGEDEEEPSVGQRLCHSVKYTILSIFLFSILVVAGIFIPFSGTPPANSTEWEKVEWFINELEADQGRDLLLFLLNIINILGLCLLICYTGYGVSSLPCGLIRPARGVRAIRSSVERQLAGIEREIRDINTRQGQTGQVHSFEQSQLERLEQQARLLRREHRDLEQRARTALSRVQVILRPFEMIIGVIFSIFGFLLFLSLLLTNLDKALHSGGPFTGYSLQNSSLPNPVDMLLVLAQQVFPLDYLLYTLMILFLLSCSMSGIGNLGIRCFCLLLFKIRAWKTPPRGMLLLVMSLMFIIMAQSIVMFSIVPDYSMFGNQHYKDTVGNVTTIMRCSAKNFPLEKDDCLPSRISVLLFAFHYKAWIFGAAYYWLTWLLLATILGGSCYSIYNLRSPQTADDEEEDLLDSDDDNDEPSNNPFD
jgi:LMBR1 domain-containing protein 1